MKKEIVQKFEKARTYFPHTENTIYFNSASYGPFSTLVRDALVDNIHLRLSAERDDSHDAFYVRDLLRKDYAGLIGAKKSEVGLSMNTSFGLNIAAFGLPLKKGDEVLLSDIEFPALVYCFRKAAEERGLKIKFIESKEFRFDIDNLQEAITKKTRVLALSYVQFFNGFKNDLAAISEICKAHGIYFVVDGIQGTGVEPINVVKSGIDIFSSGAQKWLLSPQGCGFFYLSDEIRDKLKHSFMSWLGVDWKVTFTDLFRYDLPFFDTSERFELGYYAVLNLLGMKASVELFKDLKVSNIQKHNHGLIDRLVEYLKYNSYYKITSSLTKKHRSSIFTFTCDDYKDLHRELIKRRIICVQREGSIRLSVHLFNNESDINRLIEELDNYSKSKR